MSKTMIKTWSPAIRLLHWSIAVLVIGMLAYGWWMNHIAPRPDRLFYRLIHADIGYVLFVLMMVRLVWRMFYPVPPPPEPSLLWERVAAGLGHTLLYIVTFTVIFFGWALSGAHKPHYDSWFGLFRVPQFTSESRYNAELFEHLHIYMAYALIGLVVLHTLAALYHHFIKRDRVLMRMIDGR